MSRTICLLVIGFLFIPKGYSKPAKSIKSFTIEIENKDTVSRPDQIIYVALSNEQWLLFSEKKQYINITENSKPIAWELQVIEGKPNLLVNLNLDAKTKHQLLLKISEKSNSSVFPKRTLAELWHKTGGQFEDKKYIGGGPFQPFDSMKVPAECTDHSFYIKYEGPGWESDKVAYRIYLDWRNAIDIFGKTVHTMVLPNVGLDGYDSYHDLNTWGMDVLKVGKSLGLGSPGFWNGKEAQRVAITDSLKCKIAANGSLSSTVNIDYFGWKSENVKVDLHSNISIEAGSRASHITLSTSGTIENICTGIVKSEGINLFQGHESTGWNYIATWGKQSLHNDNLGLAVLYRTESLKILTSDEYSHVVVLKPENKTVDYYFIAAWELEPMGIQTQVEFENYLKTTVNNLNHPVKSKLVTQK